MKHGLHHVALAAKNLDETVHFYKQAFGFTELRRWGDETPAAMLDMGGGNILEVFSGSGEAPEGNARWLHIALQSDDTGRDYASALAAGAESQTEPKDITLPGEPPLPARIAFVRGLNGEVIEIFQVK